MQQGPSGPEAMCGAKKERKTNPLGDVIKNTHPSSSIHPSICNSSICFPPAALNEVVSPGPSSQVTISVAVSLCWSTPGPSDASYLAPPARRGPRPVPSSVFSFEPSEKSNCTTKQEKDKRKTTEDTWERNCERHNLHVPRGCVDRV